MTQAQTTKQPGKLAKLHEMWQSAGDGELLPRAFALELAVAEGINPSTARTQYQVWFKREQLQLSVRAESKRGLRLSPRKADLHRWREVFAEKLRELGIDAEATRQASRGRTRHYQALWRLKASDEGRERSARQGQRVEASATRGRRDAMQAWNELVSTLSRSTTADDQRLAMSIKRFVLDARDPQGLRRAGPGVSDAERGLHR